MKLALWTILFSGALAATALAKDHPRSTREEYLRRAGHEAPAVQVSTPGSLWQDGGQLANVTSDYKARAVGDLITILIVQDTTAENSGSVTSNRTYSASAGIQALAGGTSTAAVSNLFSPQSSSSLSGKGQATSKLTLRTTLAGRIIAVLPGGTYAVEAQRDLAMNNERQTAVVRGLARAGDIAPDNSIASTQLAELEIEIKGRGVISDGTRPPHPVLRLLWRWLVF